MAKKEIVTKHEMPSNSDENVELGKSSYKGDDMKVELPKGAEKIQNWNGDEIQQSELKGKQSVFSNFFIFRNPANVYTDEDFATKRSTLNPTAEYLINNGIGANKYDINDFLFLKKYNQLPLNRLITLRRFQYPTGDSITSHFQQEPDIARLLTYFDQEDNKLESIMSMTFGMKWKQLESATESANMIGDQSGASGFQKKILKFVDPQFGNNALRGENELNYDPTHDSNKVYGEVDSIASTHIRDVGLSFDQQITLTFDWEVKSIDGLNGKAVMLDLIGQILAMCTNDAKFWGGARYWTGSPRPSRMAKDLRKLANAEYIKYINSSGQDLKSYVATAVKNLFSLENIQNVAENLAKLGMGQILDKLGRPSIPVMNSLLTGEPVGMWHVQIGNPLNPIMSMGNMIMDSSVLSVPNGALGIDDFPTALRLEVTLKHAMPRGRAEIENMFTSGAGRVYWKPEEDDRKKMHGGNKTKRSLEGDIIHAVDDAVKGLYGFAKKGF